MENFGKWLNEADERDEKWKAQRAYFAKYFAKEVKNKYKVRIENFKMAHAKFINEFGVKNYETLRKYNLIKVKKEGAEGERFVVFHVRDTSPTGEDEFETGEPLGDDTPTPPRSLPSSDPYASYRMKKPEPPDRKYAGTSENFACQLCGKVGKRSDPRCKNCGAEGFARFEPKRAMGRGGASDYDPKAGIRPGDPARSPAPMSKSAPAPIDPKASVECKSCGIEGPRGTATCPTCGASGKARFG
jgi:RNA polymerase subunit RPABC4/transcription elongation factor Spt4